MREYVRQNSSPECVHVVRFNVAFEESESSDHTEGLSKWVKGRSRRFVRVERDAESLPYAARRRTIRLKAGRSSLVDLPLEVFCGDLRRGHFQHRFGD